MSKILNQSQAEAIYSAMCALNNVGGRIVASVPKAGTNGHSIVVREIRGVGIQMRDGFREDSAREDYADQSAFATAYNLDQG